MGCGLASGGRRLASGDLWLVVGDWRLRLMTGHRRWNQAAAWRRQESPAIVPAQWGSRAGSSGLWGLALRGIGKGCERSIQPMVDFRLYL